MKSPVTTTKSSFFHYSPLVHITESCPVIESIGLNFTATVPPPPPTARSRRTLRELDVFNSPVSHPGPVALFLDGLCDAENISVSSTSNRNVGDYGWVLV